MAVEVSEFLAYSPSVAPSDAPTHSATSRAVNPLPYFLQYISDEMNFLEWVAYILIVVGCGLRAANLSETNSSASIVALGTVLLWLKLTHFLRPDRRVEESALV